MPWLLGCCGCHDFSCLSMPGISCLLMPWLLGCCGCHDFSCLSMPGISCLLMPWLLGCCGCHDFSCLSMPGISCLLMPWLLGCCGCHDFSCLSMPGISCLLMPWLLGCCGCHDFSCVLMLYLLACVHGWPSTQPGSLHTALQRKYTQPCSLFSRGTAVWTMGARLCEQWDTAVPGWPSARLCRWSPVCVDAMTSGDFWCMTSYFC